MATKEQQRVAKVLGRMSAMAMADEGYAGMFTDLLENVLENGLNELNGEDAFGTEGQNDPRGDFRNGSWSMRHVEGIDG